MTGQPESIVELREFVCKRCEHKVVVNPNFPKDYTPTHCTPCYELEQQESIARVMPALIELMEMFQKLSEGKPIGPPGPAIRAMARRNPDRIPPEYHQYFGIEKDDEGIFQQKGVQGIPP